MEMLYLLMTPLKIVLELLNTAKRKWLTDHFVSQGNRQAQENEGGHTFTEPSQTNQRTDVDRKASSVTERNDVCKIKYGNIARRETGFVQTKLLAQICH
jgi:hypothetical protein